MAVCLSVCMTQAESFPSASIKLNTKPYLASQSTIASPKFLLLAVLENMASENTSGRHLEASTTSDPANQPNTKGASKTNFGKAVARRAVSGSHRRRVHGKKVASGDARLLPSRLSKVSMAEDSTD